MLPNRAVMRNWGSGDFVTLVCVRGNKINIECTQTYVLVFMKADAKKFREGALGGSVS